MKPYTEERLMQLPRGYYMSEEQENAAITAKLNEFDLVKSHLESTLADAAEVGRALVGLGNSFVNHPEDVYFSGAEARFRTGLGQPPQITSVDLNPERLSALVEDIRATSKRKGELFDALKTKSKNIQY